MVNALTKLKGEYFLYVLKIEIAGNYFGPSYHYVGKTMDINNRLKNHTGIFRQDSRIYFPNHKSAAILKKSNANIQVLEVEEIWHLNLINTKTNDAESGKLENILVRYLNSETDINPSNVYRGGDLLKPWSLQNFGSKNDLNDATIN